MLETAGISILMKAADFLFEEGRKILKERRERRQTQPEQVETASANMEPTAEVTPESVPSDVIQTKKDLLRQQISEEVWAAREREIRHLVSLLKDQSRSYYLAKEQYAKWGSALVPQIIVHNLEEAENELADTMRSLRATLNEVYGKDIIIPELEEGNEQ